MKSHGLLMTPDLIRATIAGIKTETRRIPTPRNCLFDGGTWPKEFLQHESWKTQLDWKNATTGLYLQVRCPINMTTHRIYPRIQPGETMYVKEAWGGKNTLTGEGYQYKADKPQAKTYEEWVTGGDMWMYNVKWKSPMFMPRWAARIVRPVLSVGYEWLHDITPQSAKAEGLETVDGFMDTWLKIYGNTDNRVVLVYKFGKENV